MLSGEPGIKVWPSHDSLVLYPYTDSESEGFDQDLSIDWQTSEGSQMKEADMLHNSSISSPPCSFDPLTGLRLTQSEQRDEEKESDPIDHLLNLTHTPWTFWSDKISESWSIEIDYSGGGANLLHIVSQLLSNCAQEFHICKLLTIHFLDWIIFKRIISITSMNEILTIPCFWIIIVSPI